jgi:AraC-like DNA-binding protein
MRLKGPTIAAQVMRPLLKLLSCHGDIPEELTKSLAVSDARGDRTPVSDVLQLVATAARIAGDGDLGLKASLCAEPDDFEVLESVAASAATIRDACETVCRYARVLSEAADYRIEVCRDKAHTVLGSTVPHGREMSDFKLSSFHLAVQRRIPEVWPELELWMTHDEPSDISLYRAIFKHVKLTFRAPFDGFVYDAWRLETSLPTANPEQHGTLRAHADLLLEKVLAGDGVIERVSADILAGLRTGNVAAELTATRLGMARRTLVRLLKQHGTSYSELLQEARYRTAVHYLRNTNHSIEDIAFVLGYSECAAFVHAFKRWSGHPPLEYRRMQWAVRCEAVRDP